MDAGHIRCWWVGVRPREPSWTVGPIQNHVPGCTDTQACNYDADAGANYDDGSCTYANGQKQVAGGYGQPDEWIDVCEACVDGAVVEQSDAIGEGHVFHGQCE